MDAKNSDLQTQLGDF